MSSSPGGLLFGPNGDRPGRGPGGSHPAAEDRRRRAVAVERMRQLVADGEIDLSAIEGAQEPGGQPVRRITD